MKRNSEKNYNHICILIAAELQRIFTAKSSGYPKQYLFAERLGAFANAAECFTAESKHQIGQAGWSGYPTGEEKDQTVKGKDKKGCDSVPV